MLTSAWAGQRLPEIILPPHGGLLAVLEAYFDESERTGGVFCVSGYVFERHHAKKFDREWRTLMEPIWPFHMVDLVAGRRQFKVMPQKQRDALLRAAVATINHRILLGVSVSCWLPEVNALAPKWIEGFGHAYTVCCHLAMCSVGMWIRDMGRTDRAAYVFETGHQAKREAQRFMDRASLSPGSAPLLENYQYYSHAFVPKIDSSHLQAADLLAWEWAKYYDETVDMNIRPLRKSLKALIENQPHKYRVAHVKGENLREFMREITAAGLAQLREGG